MCWGCVAEELTEAVVITQEHLDIAGMVDALHRTEWGACGGPLHIITDDTNVDDEHLIFCANAVRDQADEIGRGGVELCTLILQRLRALLTLGDRAVAVNLDRWSGIAVGTMVIPQDADDGPWAVLASRWPRVGA